MSAATDSRISLVRVNCALCGCVQSEPELVGRDNEHDLAGRFNVVACTRCGHRYLDPRPAPDSIGVLYPDDYGAFGSSRRSVGASIRRRIAHRLQFGERPTPGSGRLLEIGCGSGANLRAFRSLGWSVQGIEPSTSAAESARRHGLDVTVGTEEAVAELDAELFDEVHALMVIEHVPDPIGTLRRLHRVAKPGARLVVSVPNYASKGRQRFGPDWYPLQLPRHFHHFTESTIRAALQQAGWDVERVWYQPTTADFFKSVRLALRGRRAARLGPLLVKMGKALDVLLLPIQAPIAQRRPPGRMTVVSRRAVNPPTRGS